MATPRCMVALTPEAGEYSLRHEPRDAVRGHVRLVHAHGQEANPRSTVSRRGAQGLGLSHQLDELPAG